MHFIVALGLFCGIFKNMIADPEVFKKYLTSRQYEVVQLLYMGYTRKDAANTLMPPVTHQAVHQIVARIRKRLITRGGVPAGLQIKIA